MDLSKFRDPQGLAELEFMEILAHKLLHRLWPELPSDEELLAIMADFYSCTEASADLKIVACLILIGPSIGKFRQEAFNEILSFK